ncbi:hypothetical protein [Tepidibacter sp. Z1-5]|uniref:hypothetical protein n=1 Tax=Tepidibacter sp. Z1-5 TaxID=3134138 RepID=UPI0030BAE1E3
MFKSRTLREVNNKILMYFAIITGAITAIGGVFQGWISKYSTVVSISSIILCLIFLFLILKLIIDEKFVKLETIEDNLNGKILDKITNIQQSISNFEHINEKIRDIEKIESISTKLDNINKKMMLEFIDHMFIQTNQIGYLILVLNNDNCDVKDYQLNINSLCINSMMFEEEICLDSRNINTISFNKLNNCKQGYSINNINFSIKKGFNIGIIKMYLKEAPEGIVKFTLLLKELQTGRIIIDNKEYTLIE